MSLGGRVHQFVAPIAVGLLAAAVALLSAKPFATGWNDGSRLAAVESIVERNTLAIDDSIFCNPTDCIARGKFPYHTQEFGDLPFGTGDKLFIRGHFYSDKPAVISIMMAAVYRAARLVGFPPIGERPDVFCWTMTVLTSGLAYVVAVVCMFRIGELAGLKGWLRFVWIAGFALCTFLPAYTQNVNNHIMLLAIVAMMCLQLIHVVQSPNDAPVPWIRLAIIGTLAGIGYNLDLGAGPLLIFALIGIVYYGTRRISAVAAMLAMALPWVAAGLGINYALGGVWKPINTVPEYSQWPGCPFNPDNMTGFVGHNFTDTVLYAANLLVGKRGLVTHNVPLFLAIPAFGLVMRRSTVHRPVLVFGLAWCAATWLLYSVLSNNSGGYCCSIRWFVPFLAPGFYLIAVGLARFPQLRPGFYVLCVWGAVMAVMMWRLGPFNRKMLPYFHLLVAGTVVSWLIVHFLTRIPVIEKPTLSVAKMRFIDRWLGTPVCFMLTLIRRCFDRRQFDDAQTSKKILFVKLAEQGSTVLAQGAIREAIRRVGRENVYFLLFAENRPILDLLALIPTNNVVAIRTRGLFGTMAAAILAIRRLRRERIDAVVDLEFFARSSAALAYLSGARRRVGYHAFAGEASYRGDLMTHRLTFNPYLHTSQAFQVMVAALDHPAHRFPTFDFAPPKSAMNLGQFRPGPAEIAAVRALIRRQLTLISDRPIIMLNANASDLMPMRRWPSQRYVELARRLLKKYPDVVIAFTGAPSEAPAVKKLVAQVGSQRCGSLAGKTSLRQLLVAYGLAEVLVTNDSGPAHFATLTPIDVVVLFGPETPRLFAAQSPRTHALWAGLACSPCITAFNDRTSACRDNVCMQKITVDHVFAEVCRVFDARQAMKVNRRRAG